MSKDAYYADFYVYPRATWNKEMCERLSRMIVRDGLGTPYPFRGYIGSWQQVNHGGYGTERLNGGIVIGDEWYPGVVRLLPEVHEDFEIVREPTWGFRIRKKAKVTNAKKEVHAGDARAHVDGISS